MSKELFVMLKYIDLKNLAPIVITTFNRPDHTQSMIESLSEE